MIGNVVRNPYVDGSASATDFTEGFRDGRNDRLERERLDNMECDARRTSIEDEDEELEDSQRGDDFDRGFNAGKMHSATFGNDESDKFNEGYDAGFDAAEGIYNTDRESDLDDPDEAYEAGRRCGLEQGRKQEFEITIEDGVLTVRTINLN
jgi:hypothetical protein